MPTSRVLVIEDDPDGRRSVVEAIEDLGLEVCSVEKGADGVERFRNGEFDLVLSDLVLPDIDGIEVLKRVSAINDRIPVIIMTAYGSVESSVKALKQGAYDYVTKPLDLDDIQSKVTRGIETARLRSEVTQLQKTLGDRYSAVNLVYRSAGMEDVVRQIGTLAGTTATVLVQGESGTGKELVARALHADGKRAAGPFVAVNCGAFTETLLESELFGHEKGAFTGASNLYKGAFERAHGGTLFLDEVGDAPQQVQVRLLRALEQREITRVGGQAAFPVDVRVISASNRELEDLVESGAFREDLFYRLKVVTIRIPPLRERRDDIRPLAERFVAAACDEHGRYIASVEPGFYGALEKMEWPGNVRQLRNVVEASVLMAPEPALRERDVRTDPPPRRADESGFVVPDNMTLEQLEREILTQLLRRYDGNRTLTAEKLGISRRTIQRKIQEHNLPF